MSEELASLIAGADLQRIGASGYLVLRGEVPTHFLKTARGAAMEVLRREHDVLQFLNGRYAAPKPEAFDVDERKNSLLTSFIDGATVAGIVASPEAPPAAAFIPLLIDHLKQIHALSVYVVPFRPTLAGRMAVARERAAGGFATPAQLERLLALRPKTPEDLVFTHGDFSLTNLILADEDTLAGVVDWGRAGIADRYQDLALFVRSFADHTHLPREEVIPLVAKAYGLETLDPEKLAFYELLDEFF